MRFDAVSVTGDFGPREMVWQEPIDRNVVGLLRDFGDAEIASRSSMKLRSMFGKTYSAGDAYRFTCRNWKQTGAPISIFVPVGVSVPLLWSILNRAMLSEF